LLLCEVAIGDAHEAYTANYELPSSLPADKHSTMGVGAFGPDEKSHIVTEEGVKVPLGTLRKIHDYDVKTKLMYNEYIVYDQKRVKVKYLVEVKFEYSSLGF
jgi:hypothetical protein